MRRYFDEMRARYPQDHAGLEAMALSFEVQLAGKDPLFSLFVTEAGIEYLFVVYRNAQVDIFSTIYAAYTGRFSLFRPFPDLAVFDYPCTPERVRGQLISLYVRNCLNVRRADRPVALFGTTPNLGHHLWNEWCGKVSAEDVIDCKQLDWVSAGNDYLNEMGDAAAPALCTVTNGFFHRGRIFRFSSLIIARSHRDAFRKKYNLSYDVDPSRICLQLRIGPRSWPDILSSVPDVIINIHRERPGVQFVIDGVARVTEHDDSTIRDEMQVFDAIKSRVRGVRLKSLLGRSFSEKIPAYDQCGYFIAPIGSGGIIPAWFLAKPGLSFGPPEMYAWVEKQEALIPEGGPFFRLFPTRADSAQQQSYAVDWPAFAHAVVQDLNSH